MTTGSAYAPILASTIPTVTLAQNACFMAFSQLYSDDELRPPEQRPIPGFSPSPPVVRGKLGKVFPDWGTSRPSFLPGIDVSYSVRRPGRHRAEQHRGWLSGTNRRRSPENCCGRAGWTGVRSMLAIAREGRGPAAGPRQRCSTNGRRSRDTPLAHFTPTIFQFNESTSVAGSR